MTEYEKPTLKTPPPPEIAVLDLDSVLFKATLAPESTKYYGIAPDGTKVGPFDNAKSYKQWIEDSLEFGGDILFGYEGDLKELERIKEVTYDDVKVAYDVFDRIIKGWVEGSGCKDWVGYISKGSGVENFRYSVASLRPYKGNRKDMEKPKFLEEVRAYAKKHPKIKVARGNYEADDAICGLAQKYGIRGCATSVDKDTLGAKNTWVYIPDEMDEPLFSSRKIVGRLYRNDKGKIVGIGDLFWLFQVLGGDPVDNYAGCEKYGKEKAFAILEEFDGVSKDYLEDAVRAVGECFKKTYGESYRYKHCTTGEDVEASWKDIMIEMCHLVYMRKSQKDRCHFIEIVENLK